MPKIGQTVAAPKNTLTPFWATADGRMVRLYQGDVIDVLRRMPSQSVHMIVTSPPYWGLRDYGTGTWEGGSTECDHVEKTGKEGYSLSTLGINADGSGKKLSANNAAYKAQAKQYKNNCGKCGAHRVDIQIGSEPRPDCLGWATGNRCEECHVCKMVDVFRELYRVLRNDGTCWLNYGDTYGGVTHKSSDAWNGSDGMFTRKIQQFTSRGEHDLSMPKSGMKSGNLVGVPWRVALALQANGWILRQDIIWAKPGPMPESVRNRCTKSHEYIFLLVKRMGYYCDMEAIKEKSIDKWDSADTFGKPRAKAEGMSDEDRERMRTQFADNTAHVNGVQSSRNKRSVWTISAHGYEGAHFAVFPPKLIEPCIKAGTSNRGCCAKCKAPWRRVVERGGQMPLLDNAGDDLAPLRITNNDADGRRQLSGEKQAEWRRLNPDKLLGWQPSCECYGKLVKREGTRLGYGSYHAHEADGVEYGLRQDVDGQSCGPASIPGKPTKVLKASWIEYISSIPLEDHPVVPCTVLDPFMGSGTTAAVSIDLGRRSVGIELSEKYLRNNAIPRIEGALLRRPSTAVLIGGKEPVKVGRAAKKK